MKMRLFSLDVFLKATSSVGRRIALIVVEGVFVVIGAGISMFIFPMVEANLQDSSLEMTPAAAFAFRCYWVIVAALLAHAAFSSYILPRVHGKMLAVWLGFGMLLPLLIVVVPLVAILSVYGMILSDLQ
jgi:hypothetical protein